MNFRDDFSKYKQYKHLNNKNVYSRSSNSSTYFCIICTVITLAFIWFSFDYVFLNRETVPDSCLGSLCQEKLCKHVKQNKVSGNLCMDLCINRTISIPQCTPITSKSVQFYQFEKPDSTLICIVDEYKFVIQDGIEMYQFKNILKERFQKYLNYSVNSDLLVKRLLKAGDVNHDERINLAEANNLMLQTSNKHIFFQILFSNKPYGSVIRNFCGGCVEVEQIPNQVRFKSDSIIQSVLNPWNIWPEWNYRAKISIGILDFFLDMLSINPNDEFGSNSLYLCSSIETSFGYTFINEAKIINFDNLLSAKELEEKLSDRTCAKDSDCVYNEQCATSCNKETKKCSLYLQKPQIVDYCLFLRKYLLDNKNITQSLEPLLTKCESLKTITNDKDFLHVKNDLPLSWDKHKGILSANNYWKKSREFNLVANELKSLIWNWTKHSKDPVKATTKSSKSPDASTTTTIKKN